MTDQDQKQLGKTLWNIADQLRGAMNADDFRDYMLSLLFLRYLSDNYEKAAKKELTQDYAKKQRRQRNKGVRTNYYSAPRLPRRLCDVHQHDVLFSCVIIGK